MSWLILFDMNCLFERFVYAQLKQAEDRQAPRRISFKAQVSRRFWSADGMQKSIRPDIISHIGTGPDLERIVMDTKWKIPRDGKPGDADLQQMHVYNVQFGARRSFLLYPRVTAKAGVRGRFVHGKALPPSFDHNCGMVFLELFDGDKLRRDLGQDLVAMLTGPCRDTERGNHSGARRKEYPRHGQLRKQQSTRVRRRTRLKRQSFAKSTSEGLCRWRIGRNRYIASRGLRLACNLRNWTSRFNLRWNPGPIPLSLLMIRLGRPYSKLLCRFN